MARTRVSAPSRRLSFLRTNGKISRNDQAADQAYRQKNDDVLWTKPFKAHDHILSVVPVRTERQIVTALNRDSMVDFRKARADT